MKLLDAGAFPAAPVLNLIGGTVAKCSDSPASSLFCVVFQGHRRCTVVHGTSAASGGGRLGAGEAEGTRLAAWASAYLAFRASSLVDHWARQGFVGHGVLAGAASASSRVSKHQSHVPRDLAIVY